MYTDKLKIKTSSVNAWRSLCWWPDLPDCLITSSISQGRPQKKPDDHKLLRRWRDTTRRPRLAEQRFCLEATLETDWRLTYLLAVGHVRWEEGKVDIPAIHRVLTSCLMFHALFNIYVNSHLLSTRSSMHIVCLEHKGDMSSFGSFGLFVPTH